MHGVWRCRASGACASLGGDAPVVRGRRLREVPDVSSQPYGLVSRGLDGEKLLASVPAQCLPDLLHRQRRPVIDAEVAGGRGAVSALTFIVFPAAI